MPKRYQQTESVNEDNNGQQAKRRAKKKTSAKPLPSGPAGTTPAAEVAAESPREGPRSVLPGYDSLDKLVSSLRTCKNIVVVTGAGISVSCGIPDFRSENGVYEMASELDLGLSCPEDLFDLEFFIDDPAPFFKFAKALYPGSYVPSLTHRFLKVLEKRKKLLRNFTQNIDGLEAQVGLKKYVACHGSFLTASCLSCKSKRKAEDIRAEVMRQEVPRCPVCRRGVMKPDITFFGEKLPHAVKRAVEADHHKADLLLVLGTSLQVAPVSRILKFIPPNIPQVLVNRELVRPPKAVSDGFDLHLLGDCDVIIQHLCERLGWEIPEPEVVSEPRVPPSCTTAAPPRTMETTTAQQASSTPLPPKVEEVAMTPSTDTRSTELLQSTATTAPGRTTTDAVESSAAPRPPSDSAGESGSATTITTTTESSRNGHYPLENGELGGSTQRHSTTVGTAAAAVAIAAGEEEEEVEEVLPASRGVAGRSSAENHAPVPLPPPPVFVPPNTYVFRSPGTMEGEGEEAAVFKGACEGVGEDAPDTAAEVVTCDGCGEVIAGDVYACEQCFGFDLCGSCYNGGQNAHSSSSTGHTFRLER